MKVRNKNGAGKRHFGHSHVGMPQQLELHQGRLAPLVPTDGERGGRRKDGGQAVVWELYLVAGCWVVFYTHGCLLFFQQVLCWQLLLSSR